MMRQWLRIQNLRCNRFGALRFQVFKRRKLVYCLGGVLVYLVYHLLSSLAESRRGSSQNLKVTSQAQFAPIVISNTRALDRTDLKTSGRYTMSYFWVGGGLPNFMIHGFDINGNEGLACLCVGLVGSGILFEGLRSLRDRTYSTFLERKLAQRVLQNQGHRLNDNNTPRSSNDTGVSSSMNNMDNFPITKIRTGNGGGDTAEASASLVRAADDEEVELATKYRDESDNEVVVEAQNRSRSQVIGVLALATLIHVIYVILAYFLMLTVMTWNVWVLVAIALGIGIGHFLFGGYRRLDVNTSFLHRPSNPVSENATNSECLDSPEDIGQGDSKNLAITDSGVEGCQPLLHNQSLQGGEYQSTQHGDN